MKNFLQFFPIYKNIVDTKILRKLRKYIKKMKEKLQKAKKNNTVKFLFSIFFNDPRAIEKNT